MRAVEIKRPGGPEVLVATQRPDPAPQAGELLIAVTASGVGKGPRTSGWTRLTRNPPNAIPRPRSSGVSDLPGL